MPPESEQRPNGDDKQSHAINGRNVDQTMSSKEKEDEDDHTGCSSSDDADTSKNKLLEQNEIDTSKDTYRSPERIAEDKVVQFYLPIFVTADMFAVSLVVPLLNSYYMTAGVTSARQREFLSSAYTSAQILGGILIGAAGDAGILTRKNTLLLSFFGSAISYGVIGFAGQSLYAVVLSRILVGLVKQTMTVGTALLAQHTTKSERTSQMGKLSSSFTIAWMVGPSAGAILYKEVGSYAPACLACFLFFIIGMLGAYVIPSTNESSTTSKEERNTVSASYSNKEHNKSNLQKFRSNLRSCFSSKNLASAIVSLLLYGWITRATSYQSLGNFYEEMYGISTHQRGYITSYKSILSFFIQNTLIKPVLEKAGNERRAAFFAATGLALATLLESGANLYVFLCIVCPLVSTCVSILGLTLKSLLTQVAPKGTLSSALAALDILQNVVAVSVPFYRTVLFSVLEYMTKCIKGGVEQCMMTGDPEPRVWLLSSAVHWLIFALIVHWLFSRDQLQKVKIQ